MFDIVAGVADTGEDDRFLTRDAQAHVPREKRAAVAGGSK